jgi:cell division protein FtsN
MVTASSAEGGDGPGEENGSPGVRPDTLQMKARAPVRADSLRPARTLLQLLASRYADSPQAARAQSMLEAMPEPVDSARGRPAAGDSVMADTALADTALADTALADTALADTAAADTAAAGAGDAAAVAADTSRASPRPAPDAQSDGPPNASTPTPDSASAPRRWAILVGPFPDRRAAGQRRDSLQATGAGGYALRVRPDTAAASYDVVIGTFESQREAAAARVRLREVLPEASRLTRVAADSTAASGRSE